MVIRGTFTERATQKSGGRRGQPKKEVVGVIAVKEGIFIKHFPLQKFASRRKIQIFSINYSLKVTRNPNFLYNHSLKVSTSLFSE